MNLAKTVTEICSFCSASVYSTHKMKHWCCKVNPIRTVAKTLILIKQRGTKRLMLINLWRPHGGGRSQAQVDACGRGRGISVMWTSTQKFRAHWRHPVFFSCKEVGIFYQNFVFGRNKIYKLVIQVTNSIVSNKLQWYYSWISVIGQEGNCSSCFKRVMCISCRRHVDGHKGRGQAHMDACGQRAGDRRPLWTS